MRLLLLHPPKKHQVWAGVPDVFNDRFAYLFPPLAVMYLSSYLKKYSSHSVRVLDCVPDNLDYSEVGAKVAAQSFDVVGITATATHNLLNVTKSAEAIKAARPDTFVVVGGAHVNSFPEQAARLKYVDAVIAGDGEKPLQMLLDTLESAGSLESVPNIFFEKEDGSIFIGQRLEPFHDLDQLEFPDREDCPPGKYFTPGMKGASATTMISSRGCPHRCVFCNVPRKYRARSAKNVVDEMEVCAKEYGIQDIHFVDDLFNVTSDRVMEISEEILSRGIKIWWGYKASIRQTTPEMVALAKRAGCYRMHYGVETFTDQGLKALNKKATIREIFEVFRYTREQGVKAIAYMIVGCPHEKSAGQINGVTDFIKRLNPNYVVYSLFTPYPDAPIFEKGIKKGLWEKDCWERFMLNPTTDHNLPTAWEEHLSKTELLAVFKKINRDFYFDPRIIWRTLSSVRTWSELKRIILGGISILRMEFIKATAGRI